jgi:hypothetical protein
MEPNQRSRIAGVLAGVISGLSPFKSLTFLMALGVAALAAWVWFKRSGDTQAAFPVYGTIAASYAGGFMIGRIFRKLIKAVAITAVLVLAGFALLNRAHVDTSKAKEVVQAGSTWAQDRASRAKDYLMHLLPSGGAAGFGVFAGGRRRREEGENQPG